MLKKNLPNLITLVRLLGTIALFFITPLTWTFYIVYTISGLSDVLDGTIARAMHTESQLGARLDSIADILFYAVMLFKILPILWIKLPVEIWYVVSAILFIRILSYIVAALKYKKFASLHTYMNKLTGTILFFVPYIIQTPISVAFCIAVCVVAMLASFEELLMHITSKGYDPSVKSILARGSDKALS